MIKIANPKKNVNKNDPNQKNQSKQNKMRDSAYCEKCADVGECKKFADYEYRMKILFKVGYGVSCNK